MSPCRAATGSASEKERALDPIEHADQGRVGAHLLSLPVRCALGATATGAAVAAAWLGVWGPAANDASAVAVVTAGLLAALLLGVVALSGWVPQLHALEVAGLRAEFATALASGNKEEAARHLAADAAGPLRYRAAVLAALEGLRVDQVPDGVEVHDLAPNGWFPNGGHPFDILVWMSLGYLRYWYDDPEPDDPEPDDPEPFSPSGSWGGSSPRLPPQPRVPVGGRVAPDHPRVGGGAGLVVAIDVRSGALFDAAQVRARQLRAAPTVAEQQKLGRCGEPLPALIVADEATSPAVTELAQAGAVVIPTGESGALDATALRDGLLAAITATATRVAKLKGTYEKRLEEIYQNRKKQDEIERAKGEPKATERTREAGG